MFAAGAFALLLAGPDASLGQSKIYSTGFEAPPFAAGAPLLGTDGWSLAIPPFLNPSAAVITDAVKKSGKQSADVWGGDLVSAPRDDDGMPLTAPYDAVGSYRHPVNYSVTAKKPIIVVEADLLLDTEEPTTEDDFFSLTIAARSGDGETLGEMGLSSAGSVDVYGFDAAAGDPTLISKPTEVNPWHRLSIVMDFSSATTTVAYFVDDEFITATPTTSTSNALLRGSMVVYARPDGGDTRDNYTARFDNFRISVHGAEE
jgi:hypothetical protein